MKRTSYLAALGLLLAGAFPLLAADDYRAIDRHALQAPRTDERSIPTLARYLVRTAENDREKARAIYRWVTDRIAYDARAFFSGRIGDCGAESVLRSRLTVCEGYANLFQALCQEAGLEAVKIHGWAKSSVIRSGNDKEPNHAWNAVKVEGRWRLVEATWGAGYLNGKSFVKRFRPYYFLTPPAQLAFSHFPEDPRWQLLKKRVSAAEFARLPAGAGSLVEMGVASVKLRAAVRKPDFGGLVKTYDVGGKKVTIRVAPLEQRLKAGARYRFRIESPDFAEMAVQASREVVRLKRQGNVFEGVVTAPEGKLILMGRAPDSDRRYDGILEYTGG